MFNCLFCCFRKNSVDENAKINSLHVSVDVSDERFKQEINENSYNSSYSIMNMLHEINRNTFDTKNK